MVGYRLFRIDDTPACTPLSAQLPPDGSGRSATTSAQKSADFQGFKRCRRRLSDARMVPVEGIEPTRF